MIHFSFMAAISENLKRTWVVRRSAKLLLRKLKR